MLFNDSRYNNYHIITRVGPNQWSTNWRKFSGFPFAFDFELSFRGTHEDKQQWLRDNWHFSLYISVVYILLVHVLQNWMKHREKGFNLRFPLALWSSGLALFSISGTIKCLPEFVSILSTKGIYASFCESCYYEVCLNLFILYITASMYRIPHQTSTCAINGSAWCMCLYDNEVRYCKGLKYISSNNIINKLFHIL